MAETEPRRAKAGASKKRAVLFLALSAAAAGLGVYLFLPSLWRLLALKYLRDLELEYVDLAVDGVSPFYARASMLALKHGPFNLYAKGIEAEFSPLELFRENRLRAVSVDNLALTVNLAELKSWQRAAAAREERERAVPALPLEIQEAGIKEGLLDIQAGEQKRQIHFTAAMENEAGAWDISLLCREGASRLLVFGPVNPASGGAALQVDGIAADPLSWLKLLEKHSLAQVPRSVKLKADRVDFEGMALWEQGSLQKWGGLAEIKSFRGSFPGGFFDFPKIVLGGNGAPGKRPAMNLAFNADVVRWHGFNIEQFTGIINRDEQGWARGEMPDTILRYGDWAKARFSLAFDYDARQGWAEGRGQAEASFKELEISGHPLDPFTVKAEGNARETSVAVERLSLPSFPYAELKDLRGLLKNIISETPAFNAAATLMLNLPGLKEGETALWPADCRFALEKQRAGYSAEVSLRNEDQQLACKIGDYKLNTRAEGQASLTFDGKNIGQVIECRTGNFWLERNRNRLVVPKGELYFAAGPVPVAEIKALFEKDTLHPGDLLSYADKFILRLALDGGHAALGEDCSVKNFRFTAGTPASPGKAGHWLETAFTAENFQCRGHEAGDLKIEAEVDRQQMRTEASGLYSLSAIPFRINQTVDWSGVDVTARGGIKAGPHFLVSATLFGPFLPEYAGMAATGEAALEARTSCDSLGLNSQGLPDLSHADAQVRLNLRNCDLVSPELNFQAYGINTRLEFLSLRHPRTKGTQKIHAGEVHSGDFHNENITVEFEQLGPRKFVLKHFETAWCGGMILAAGPVEFDPAEPDFTVELLASGIEVEKVLAMFSRQPFEAGGKMDGAFTLHYDENGMRPLQGRLRLQTGTQGYLSFREAAWFIDALKQRAPESAEKIGYVGEALKEMLLKKLTITLHDPARPDVNTFIRIEGKTLTPNIEAEDIVLNIPIQIDYRKQLNWGPLKELYKLMGK